MAHIEPAVHQTKRNGSATSVILRGVLKCSFFTRYANLSTEDAIATARSIWQEINSPNLRENILPSRERAHLILSKGKDNTIQQVKLRKL